MPWTTHVLPDQHLIVVACSGELGVADIVAFRRELEAHPDFSRGMNELTDLRNARMLLTEQERHELVEDDPIDSGARRAILVRDDIHYGTMRAYGAVGARRDFDFRPFRELSEACAWLGVDPRVLPAGVREGGAGA